jgi:hypothetical protein
MDVGPTRASAARPTYLIRLLPILVLFARNC